MFTIVACILRSNDKILLLRRLPEKSQGNKWGLPAGKLEKDETPLVAMTRELREETGYNAILDDIVFEGTYTFNISQPGEYRILLYSLELPTPPEIVLCPTEHAEACWLPLDHCLRLADLIPDTAALLEAKTSL